MDLIKKIKKIGGSKVIILDKEDLERYNVDEDDWVNIGNMMKLNKKEIGEK